MTDASKKTCVKTDSSVKYHYSYVERQELDPITETKTVTTPDDDDGDGGDKIIEEKDHDSPVLPGTPELPPVQDAKPDAPVPPADPALPAVQDAHALPQTGVNWLAAIGLGPQRHDPDDHWRVRQPDRQKRKALSRAFPPFTNLRFPALHRRTD